MKKNRKKILVVVAVAIFMLALSSTGFAAYFETTLKAAYRNIKVYKNNQQVSFSHEPFIVDGTTYVPLRDMSELLDKNVTWNGSTYEIGINDKPGQANTTELYNQIVGLQQQVTQLQNENKKLKEQAEEEKVIDLDDLEENLIDDYEDEFKSDDIYLEISIKGDEDEVKVTIEALEEDDDGDLVYDIIDAVGESDLENLLEDIYDDIIDEYEDAEVTGYVKDDQGKINFEFDKKGNVELDY